MNHPTSEQAALAALQAATREVSVIARVIATEVNARYRSGPCDVCGADSFRRYAKAVAVEDEAWAKWLEVTQHRGVA